MTHVMMLAAAASGAERYGTHVLGAAKIKHNILANTERNIKMKLYKEESISDFEFWSGAKDKVKYLTYEELDTVESILEDIYPDGIDETTLNDIFWFEDDLIAEWLGYDSFEEIMERGA